MAGRVPYLTWSANNTFSQWGGDWLRTWNPAIGDDKPADSSCYWYTSPNDVFLLHVYGLPGLSLLVWALCKYTTPWRVAVPRARLASASTSCWQRFLAVVDMILRAACIIALSATVYYKVAGDRLAYLGQPCHWLCALLAFLCFRSDSDKAAAPIFNFVINCMYGPILAMLMPDNAENVGFENVNFWLEHGVLFALPVVWMARRRFHIYSIGAANVVASWAVFFIVHGAVLTPWSILSGRNIDYMMMPPPKYPATLYPQWYRHLIMAVTLGFAFATRAVYTGGALLLTGAYSAAAAEAKEAAAANAKAAALVTAAADASVPAKQPSAVSSDAPAPSLPRPEPGIEAQQALAQRPVSRVPRALMQLAAYNTLAEREPASASSAGSGATGGAGAMPEAPVPPPAEVLAATAALVGASSVATEAVGSRPGRARTPAAAKKGGKTAGPATAKKQALIASLNSGAVVGAGAASSSSAGEGAGAGAASSSSGSGSGSVFRFTPYKSPSRVAGAAAALHRGAAGGTPAPSRGRKLAAQTAAESSSDSDSSSDSSASPSPAPAAAPKATRSAARPRSTAGATPSRRSASKAGKAASAAAVADAAPTPARRTASKASKAAAASATPAASASGSAAAPRTATRRKASATSARK